MKRDFQPRLGVDIFFTAKQQLRLSVQWAAIRAQEQDFYLIPEGGGTLMGSRSCSGRYRNRIMVTLRYAAHHSIAIPLGNWPIVRLFWYIPVAATCPIGSMTNIRIYLRTPSVNPLLIHSLPSCAIASTKTGLLYNEVSKSIPCRLQWLSATFSVSRSSRLEFTRGVAWQCCIGKPDVARI